MDSSPRILYIDAYDSFSNNIVGLLEAKIPSASITVIRIDDYDDDATATSNQDDSNSNSPLHPLLSHFDAVVVGPGPGHPYNHADVGIISKLWTLPDAHQLPILGICLGFQSLAYAAGARIERMKKPRHGLVNPVVHCGTDIFEGLEVGGFEATQYHSLCADIGHEVQQQGGENVILGAAAAAVESEGLWARSHRCPELQPLAWDLSDAENGPVLMAVRHAQKPFWGVQFHPESICTVDEGKGIVGNWWAAARAWLKERGRVRKAGKVPLLSRPSQPMAYPERSGSRLDVSAKVDTLFGSCLPGNILPDNKGSFLWATHPLGAMTTVDVCEAMGLTDKETVILDSQGHNSGRYSIVGLVSEDTGMKLTYTAHDRRLLVSARGGPNDEFEVDSINDLWPLLQRTLDKNAPTAPDRPDESPFWGGWMGYISYEAGLETLNVKGVQQAIYAPDVNFAFIERSIVIDHEKKQVYLQSLIDRDNTWLLETGKKIDKRSGKFGSSDDNDDRLLQMLSDSTSEDIIFEDAIRSSYIERPAKDAYCEKVLKCQDSLSAGDSYELCLTDETHVCIPRTTTNSPHHHLLPWIIYKKLRENNPAPFGCFIRLPHATVVGSSPERFLNWTRSGRCQFRPIKGTVRKTPDIDLAAAKRLLGTSKERAENLMIVDLIRHDLSGVIGAANCTVPKLMQVEEYRTVYQLVSVIEGRICGSGSSSSSSRSNDSNSNNNSNNNNSGASAETGANVGGAANTSEARRRQPPRGIDVLRASLPPGSMTGAPKKRSCEILRDLEDRPRGIYSGVVGYMDVGGGGDFSVVIRTATRWDQDTVKRPLKKAAATQRKDDYGRDGGGGGGGGRGGVDGVGCSEGEGDEVPHDVWRIGAGGAVTIQSTALGEFDEMETKLDSVLKTFQV